MVDTNDAKSLPGQIKRAMNQVTCIRSTCAAFFSQGRCMEETLQPVLRGQIRPGHESPLLAVKQGIVGVLYI